MSEQRITVSDIMNPHVISCSSDSTMREAIDMLQQHRIHALVVVEGPGFLAGVFSQTDALRAWREGLDYEQSMNSPVASFMTTSVVTCMAHLDMTRAAKLLTDHKIHRLVVVEERNDGRVWPVGVISQTDIVRQLSGMMLVER